MSVKLSEQYQEDMTEKDELLESMIHLKDFHLYVELREKRSILTAFYHHFKRHWIFGTHFQFRQMDDFSIN